MRLGLIMGISLFAASASADIFAPSASGSAALREVLTEDRSGYYLHSPEVSPAGTEKKVSEADYFSTGVLKRDRGLYDVDAAFNKEFDASYTKESSFNKYKLARNSLLLLSYSSPALADILKHYRTMSAQRVALEQERLAVIEEGTQSALDRLRMLSERECIRQRQGEGLVRAMEACKGAVEPFDALSLLSDKKTLADGRLNIHVIRDSIALLGLSEKTAGDQVAALSGDTVISSNDLKELLPKHTFESRVEYHQQKYLRKWRDLLRPEAERESGLTAAQLMGEVSLPGVPVTEAMVRSFLIFDESMTGGLCAKLSSYLARAEARREYEESMIFIGLAQNLPQIPTEFKRIMSSRGGYLKGVVSRSGTEAEILEGYRSLLAGIMKDADTVRRRLLADEERTIQLKRAQDSLLML